MYTYKTQTHTYTEKPSEKEKERLVSIRGRKKERKTKQLENLWKKFDIKKFLTKVHRILNDKVN